MDIMLDNAKKSIIAGEQEIQFPAHIRDDGAIQSNLDHCKNVARYSQGFLEMMNLGYVGLLAGLLHDCGKFTETFAEYITKAAAGEKIKKGSVIHSFAGLSLIMNKYHSLDFGYRDLTAEIMAVAIGSHHGLFDCIDPDGESGIKYRLTKQEEYDRNAITNFFQNIVQLKN